MIGYLRMFATLFRIAILGQIQYRASGMIWMIGSVLEPTIYLVVWSEVAEARGGVVAGFGAREFAAYYITYLFVNHLTFTWVMQVFQFRVQYGDFSSQLLRPIHPVHGDVADNLAYKLVMMVVMLPAVALLVFSFEPRWEVVPWSLAAALPAIVLGFAVRFCIEWTIALAAFWTTRVTAINQIYFTVLLFVSGRVAPLALLPVWLADVARGLPFYWMIGFPVELAVGRVAPAEAWAGFGMQALWLAASVAVIASAWRFAVRRFSAVGA